MPVTRDLRTVSGATYTDTRMVFGRIMGRLIFDTIAEAQAATIPADVSTIWIAGAYEPGDAGPPMMCRRVDAQPALHSGWIRSTDRFKRTPGVLRGGDFEGRETFFTLVGASKLNGKLNVTNGTDFLVQTSALTSGTTYNFSMDLNVTAPPSQKLQIRTEANVVLYDTGLLSAGPQVKSGSFTADGTTFKLVASGNWYTGTVDNLIVTPASGAAYSNATYGGYWEYVSNNQPLYIEWFGGKADYLLPNMSVNPTPTDNLAPFNKAVAFVIPLTGSFPGSQAGPAIQLGYGGYYTSDKFNPNRSIALMGMGVGYVGGDAQTRVYVASGKGGVKLNPAGSTGSASVVRDINFKSLGAGGQTTAHGLQMLISAAVYNCSFDGFGGHGIEVYADVTVGTNANTWRVRDCSMGSNVRSGLHVQGGDANAGTCNGLNLIANGEYGIDDESFLANGYNDCHTAQNVLGPYRMVGGNGPITAGNMYSENDQPQSIAGNFVCFTGGLHGAGVNISTGGSWVKGRTHIGGIHSFSPGATAVNFKTTKTSDSAYSFDFNDGQPFDMRYFTHTWGLQWANSSVSFGHVSDANTTQAFGKPGPMSRSVLQPGTTFTLYGFLSSRSAFHSDARLIGHAPSVPGGGAWGAGEIAWNNAGGSLQGWWNKTQGFAGGAWTSGQSLFAPAWRKASNGNYYLMDNTNGTSTVEPTHTSGSVTGADGLRWTYLGTGDANWIKMSSLVYEVAQVIDLPSVAAGAISADQTVAVTGVVTGDIPFVSYRGDSQGLAFNAWVPAADTIKFHAINRTANPIDLASGTFTVGARPRVT